MDEQQLAQTESPTGGSNLSYDIQCIYLNSESTAYLRIQHTLNSLKENPWHTLLKQQQRQQITSQRLQ